MRNEFSANCDCGVHVPEGCGFVKSIADHFPDRSAEKMFTVCRACDIALNGNNVLNKCWQAGYIAYDNTGICGHGNTQSEAQRSAAARYNVAHTGSKLHINYMPATQGIVGRN